MDSDATDAVPPMDVKTRRRSSASESSKKKPFKQLSIGVLANYVAFAVRRTHNEICAQVSEVLSTHGLTPGQFAVLMVIGHNPAPTQMDVGRTLDIQKANFVPLIAGLEKRGLVVRAACAADRRAQRLRLTAAGRALLRKAIRAHDNYDARLAKKMGGRNNLQLIEELNKVFVLLREVPPAIESAQVDNAAP